MRIHELIKEGVPCDLYHPELGNVKWDLLTKGDYLWCLHWAKGPEKDRPLVADEVVLLDDRWSIQKEII